MRSAREEVLLRGLVDWVALERIHKYVARECSGAPLSVIQNDTVELIRSVVSEDLFLIGDLTAPGSRFRAWNTPLDQSMQRIRDVYVDRFDDQNIWPWFCWLE